jgi:hypothetical protein
MPAATKPKPENLWLNLACNLALPTAIWSWGSGDKGLGPKWGLIVAVAFPLGYGLYDFATRRRFNFISIVGFASVLITGGFTLMKLNGFWFAVKDAALPTLIGVAVLASMRAKEPLVHEMLFNPQVIDVEKVSAALDERGAQGGFQRLLLAASQLLALAMFISALLNFFLARYLLKSPAGSVAFNAELAKMHWASWIVMLLTSMPMMLYALWRLLKGVEQLTGLSFDDIMHQPPEKKKTEAAGAQPAPPDSTSE